jgi:hypothetical protein
LHRALWSVHVRVDVRTTIDSTSSGAFTSDSHSRRANRNLSLCPVQACVRYRKSILILPVLSYISPLSKLSFNNLRVTEHFVPLLEIHKLVRRKGLWSACQIQFDVTKYGSAEFPSDNVGMAFGTILPTSPGGTLFTNDRVSAGFKNDFRGRILTKDTFAIGMPLGALGKGVTEQSQCCCQDVVSSRGTRSLNGTDWDQSPKWFSHNHLWLGGSWNHLWLDGSWNRHWLGGSWNHRWLGGS